jgi:hypothetical protein
MTKSGRKNQGYSILEMTVSMAILVIVLAGSFGALSASRSIFQTGVTLSSLQDQARKALDQISREVRQSGTVMNDPYSPYPYLFVDGNAEGYYAHHWHPPTVSHASPGDPDYGPNREIVFRMAEDVDGDGFLTDATTGEIEWGPNEISYVVITAADGVNELQRRINGYSPVTVVRNVERLVFDDYHTDPELTKNQISIVIHIRKSTRTGRVLRSYLSTTVNMRNSWEEQ